MLITIELPDNTRAVNITAIYQGAYPSLFMHSHAIETTDLRDGAYIKLEPPIEEEDICDC